MFDKKGKLAEIEIKLLRVTDLNPRKIRNPIKDEELFASVKTRGVVDPLLVRPSGKHFEIAAGSRRREAAERAKLKTVPCVVREMTDEEFLEIALFENLQREDMHALDEADAFVMMRDAMGLDVEAISGRVSKPVQYVALTIKLLDLIPAAKKLFSTWKIERNAALLICRLAKDAQKDLVDDRELPPVVNEMFVRRWIDRNVSTNLKNAAFPIEDADLVKKAGSCLLCPKRSGSASTLFADVKDKDQCFDRSCFAEKMKAHFDRTTKAWDAKGETWSRISIYYSGDEKKKILGEHNYRIVDKRERCPSTIHGIYVDGTTVGRVVMICSDRECKPHRQSDSAGRSVSTPGERFEQRKNALKTERERDLRWNLLTAVSTKVSGAGAYAREDLMTIVCAVFDRLWSDGKRAYFARRGLVPVKRGYIRDFETPFRKFAAELQDNQLYGLLVEVALCNLIVFERSDKAALLDVAKLHKIDVAAIEKAVDADIDAKIAKAKERLDRAKENAKAEPKTKGSKKAKAAKGGK